MSWFVRNAREARWLANELGAFCNFEDGDARFPELGINLTVVEPGRPTCMYHREPHQEGFLVLRGECLLVVEGEKVRLPAWDFFHCPPNASHVIVGAGTTSSLVLAVGSRVGPQRRRPLPRRRDHGRARRRRRGGDERPRRGARALLAGRSGALPRGVPGRNG